MSEAKDSPRLAKVRPAFDPAFYGAPTTLPFSDLEPLSVPEIKPSNSSLRAEDTLKQVRELMAENLSRPDFSLAEVAKQVCVCERQLQRIFKQAGSPGFRKELAVLRMKAAARLLSDGLAPVSWVSEQVGYRQPMHFAKAFRRQWNCTPRQYRARYR